jgi:hypothetical protein
VRRRPERHDRRVQRLRGGGAEEGEGVVDEGDEGEESGWRRGRQQEDRRLKRERWSARAVRGNAGVGSGGRRGAGRAGDRLRLKGRARIEGPKRRHWSLEFLGMGPPKNGTAVHVPWYRP